MTYPFSISKCWENNINLAIDVLLLPDSLKIYYFHWIIMLYDFPLSIIGLWIHAFTISWGIANPYFTCSNIQRSYFPDFFSFDMDMLLVFRIRFRFAF